MAMVCPAKDSLRLMPADLRKEGSYYDLLLIGILVAHSRLMPRS
jgi:predicted ATPase with chaperone activity